MNTPLSPRTSSRAMWDRRSWLKTTFLGIAAGTVAGSAQLFAQGKRSRSFRANVFSRASGEWGNLEYEQIVLEPDENILDGERLSKPTRWFFKNYSLSQLNSLFQIAGIPGTDLNAISQGPVSTHADGISFYPRREFLLKLTPESRGKIYAALVADSDASRYFDVFLFENDYLDLTLEQTTLSPVTLKLFRSLLYKRNNLSAFSDAPLVLETLHDAPTKAAFLKMLVRRPALSVRLKLNDGGKGNVVSDYWSIHGRSKELLSAIQQAVSNQATSIDITELLPQWVQKRLNTFPASGDKLDVVRNCHWTSLNFFNDQPNDGYLFIDEVEKELTSNYGKVNSAPQLGDVVLFRNSSHNIVHSAAFIADNVVLTKNGEGTAQPWCLMKVTDVIDLYTALMGPMSVKIYRKRVV